MCHSRLIGLTIVGALLSGCPDRGEGRGAATATAALAHLRDFDVISGTLPVTATPGPHRRLELLANGKAVGSREAAPFKFSWDTSKVPDGLAELTLRGDGKEVHRVQVVVLNRGAEVFFKSGSEKKIVVPLTSERPPHLRYHWDMSEGTKKVLAILSWERAGFDLELALGRGACPHHGETVAKQHATRSPLILLHEGPADGTAPAGQWFAHVRVLNPEQLLGQETPITLRAYVLR
jgi:hypothetical protein